MICIPIFAKLDLNRSLLSLSLHGIFKCSELSRAVITKYSIPVIPDTPLAGFKFAPEVLTDLPFLIFHTTRNVWSESRANKNDVDWNRTESTRGCFISCHLENCFRKKILWCILQITLNWTTIKFESALSCLTWNKMFCPLCAPETHT